MYILFLYRHLPTLKKMAERHWWMAGIKWAVTPDTVRHITLQRSVHNVVHHPMHSTAARSNNRSSGNDRHRYTTPTQITSSINQQTGFPAAPGADRALRMD